MFQDIHARLVTSALATALLAIFPAAPTTPLAGIEMRASQMCSSIIIGTVALPIATSLAIRKEVLAGRDILADPDCADRGVHAVDMTAQLMFAVEAIRMICAQAAVCLWSRGSSHRGLGDSGDLLCRAVCRGDAKHLVGVELGHAALRGLDFWSNGTCGLSDLLFGAARGARALCRQVIAVDGVGRFHLH